MEIRGKLVSKTGLICMDNKRGKNLAFWPNKFCINSYDFYFFFILTFKNIPNYENRTTDLSSVVKDINYY